MEVGEGLLPPLPLPPPEPALEPLPDPELDPLPLLEPEPADELELPEPLLPVPGCEAEGVVEVNGVLFAVVGLELPPHPVITRTALMMLAANNGENEGIRNAALNISGPPDSGALPNTDGEQEVWCCLDLRWIKAG